MNVFITGATGWVGSAIVRELVTAGHRVSGLCRSPEKAAHLARLGAIVVTGTLDDPDVLSGHASRADAVIHTAFNHDFSKFAENAEQDRRIISLLGDALAGSRRPLIVTAGLARIAAGRPATEADFPDPSAPRKSDAAAQELRDRGIRATVVRLAPSVHGHGDHGFLPLLIGIARSTGVSAYVQAGLNRWAGVHLSDAARLYRLVLETDAAEPVYHAAAEDGVPFKDIAETIGRRLGLPVESRPREHFGWFGHFAAAEMAASSTRTRTALNWRPTGPGMLEDLDHPAYFTA